MSDKTIIPETPESHREGEQSLLTAGQRRVNLIWEITQSLIAMTVVASTLYVAVKQSLMTPSETAAVTILSNAFFLVVGFYFGRTNHQRIGGVGNNEIGR